MMDAAYQIRDCSELLSPALLIYRRIVRQNLETMIAMARGAQQLRPHVKTHKMAEIVADWKSRWAFISTSAPPSPRPRWSPRRAGLTCSSRIRSSGRM